MMTMTDDGDTKAERERKSGGGVRAGGCWCLFRQPRHLFSAKNARRQEGPDWKQWSQEPHVTSWESGKKQARC